MLHLTPAAAQYIRLRETEVYLELPPMINSCIHVQEAPVVKMGKPADLENHSDITIDGITVYVPLDFPDIQLTIDLTSFLFYKKLAVEGWQLV